MSATRLANSLCFFIELDLEDLQSYQSNRSRYRVYLAAGRWRGAWSHVFASGGNFFLRRSLSSCKVTSRCLRCRLPGVAAAGIGTGCGGVLLWYYWPVDWRGRQLALLNGADCSERSRVAPLVAEDSPEGLTRFSWCYLWHFLRPYIHYLCGAVLSAVVVAVCNVQIPQLLGELVNCLPCVSTAAAASSWSSSQLLPAAKQLIISYSCQAVCTVCYILCLAHVGEGMAADMRARLFGALLAQDIAFFDQHKTGELINRLSADVQDFKSSFKLCISQGLRSTAQITGCVYALHSISPTLTYLTCCGVTTMVCVGVLIGRILRTVSREAQQQSSHATSLAEEALSNIRTVRAFAMEEVESSYFRREVVKARDLHVLLGGGIGVFQAGANLFVNGAVLATLWAGGSMLVAGDLAPGQLMAFLVAAQTIQRSLAQLSVIFGTYVRGISAGSRVFEYMSKMPEIPIYGGDTISPVKLKGAVEFRNVKFSYPSRPNIEVLNDFQLTLEPGEVTALVGLSGSGKSTCAALLERFYDVESGGVFLDDCDVRELDPHWLRSRVIGYIHQEPTLFSTSIRENIRYGRLEATDQEVEEAARLADVHQFVSSLPLGYDTPVGERGVTLSGGQRQRIAIARAVLKNPAVLILDEATSALDSESERNVQQALDRVACGRTVLVIAHRLSTVRSAHSIAVIAGGKVIEMGTHDELMKKKGAYWDLVKYNTV